MTLVAAARRSRHILALLPRIVRKHRGERQRIGFSRFGIITDEKLRQRRISPCYRRDIAHIFLRQRYAVNKAVVAQPRYDRITYSDDRFGIAGYNAAELPYTVGRCDKVGQIYHLIDEQQHIAARCLYQPARTHAAAPVKII